MHSLIKNNLLYSSLFVAGFALCSSCGNEAVKDNQTTLNYAIDTVYIDSKNEIIYLKRRLYTSDYSDFDGMFYNLNDGTNQVEQINLNNLALEKIIPFEQEGPNGTGFWTSDLKIASEQQLFLGGERSGIYNLSGKLLHRFDWYAVDKEKGGLLDEERVHYQMVNPNFQHQVFAVVVNDQTNSVSLRQLNSSKSFINIYDIDPNENYKTYTLGDLTNYNNWDPRVHIKSIQDHIIVSHEFANDFYVLYPVNDSLISISYQSSLFESKVKPTTEGDLINSFEDRKNALKSYQSQIVYGPFAFDKKNRHYVRLSGSIIYGDKEREEYLLPEIDSSTLYISIFDENFNHLLDQEIPELKRSGIPQYFIRAGELWMYLNFEDELAFVRIKF
ncbi:DUF4221 family protein [Belliella marina]|uniref:DUF4221 family protein n=1 Tax=Belliella marina TaxID=1644146 RepID=A0ABW4VMM1_9BACT